MELENSLEVDLRELNDNYRKLSVHQRVEQLYNDFKEDEIMLTSSFASTSAFLLKVFSDVNKSQKIYFIDTGYHFNETLIYKDYLIKLYDLNVEDVSADQWKHKFTTEDQTWKKDPNYCCSINKVEPLQSIKDDHKVSPEEFKIYSKKRKADITTIV